MKILLLAPPIMDDFTGAPEPIAMDAVRECPPYGMYLLRCVLLGAGHEAVLADLIADGSKSIDPYLGDLAEADLVGIGATSMSWPTAQDVIGQIRRAREDVPIVLGGIHPTMFDRYLLSHFPVDYVVRGEGEQALLALCDAIAGRLPVAKVPNLSWKTEDGRVVRNGVGAKIHKHHLADYPVPDFANLPDGVYKGLSIESSRGCVFDCSFCSTSYRQTWRGMPAGAFVDRLERMMPSLSKTQLGMIHIVDDEFSMNPKRAIEITDVLRERDLAVSLVYDSRANDVVYDGFIPSIAEFTSQFLIGAECGYDEGLELIGKGTTTDLLERAAAVLYRNGISERADFSFILGLPWETEAEVRRTCKFAAHLYATYGVRILLQWYCQIPGSRLWEADRQAGWVNESMYDTYGFFRDLYLFRTGVKLSPSEVWSVSHSVEALLRLAQFRHPKQVMVEYGHPEPISIYFPEDMIGSPDGLANLREVSGSKGGASSRQNAITLDALRPVAELPQRPLRHFGA